MGNTVYQYPACTTCRKALKWLGDQKISFEPVHIADDVPDEQLLRSVIEKSGLPLRRFFNTSGKRYRELGLKDRMDTMTVDEAVKLLAADGMLIKRPLLISGEKVLVGFNEKQWSEAGL